MPLTPTLGAETRSQVQNQPGLYNKTLSPKAKQNNPPCLPKPMVLRRRSQTTEQATSCVVCDLTDRKYREWANPEMEIGLVVARAAGGPRKGWESCQLTETIELCTSNGWL